MEGRTIVLGKYRFYLNDKNIITGMSAAGQTVPSFIFQTAFNAVPDVVLQTLVQVSPPNP